ncbi:MAG: ribosome maturation factor RimM [Dehalococcoidia bacterium]
MAEPAPLPPAPPPPRPLRPAVREGFVAVGVVLTSFGLHGDIKVDPLTDFPERFDAGKQLWLAERLRRIERSRRQGKFVIVKLTGIDTPEAIAELRGQFIEVPEGERIALSPDVYYQSDVVGLRVHTLAGADLGTVIEFLPTGGNDVLVVRGPAGDVLIPMIDDVVKQIDIADGRMLIDAIDGLLPDTPARSAVERRRAPRRRRSESAKSVASDAGAPG